MKITLIMPAVSKMKNKSYIKSWQMEPLSLAVLAGLTPKDVKIVFYDDRLEAIPYDEPTDLVGISVETYTAKRAYQISNQFRQRGIKVILGGFHPTLIPQEAIKYADSVVIGEAEELWEEIIEDCMKNRLKKFYKSKNRPSLGGIRPKREIFKGKHYLPISLLETGRGCKFNCNFCSISAFFNSTHNYRPIQDVIEEIKTLDNKVIFFVDDNITSNIYHAKELFKALIPLKIRWISQATISIAKDDELIRLMVESGCIGLLIGLESLNKNNLYQMNKAWSKREEIEVLLEKLHNYGIMVYATFIFGFDSDDKESFEQTLKFAIKHKFTLTAFNHLVPFPGTPLYNIFQRQQRLLYKKWWLDEGYQFGEIAFQPKLISPETLAKTCFNYRSKFYTLTSVIRRGLDFKVNYKNIYNFTIFISQNLLAKKDVKRKQGMVLGGLNDEQNYI